MRKVKSEDVPEYRVMPGEMTTGDDQVIARALQILRNRVTGRDVMTDVKTVGQYLQLRAAGDDAAGREVFGVMFLDAQHRVISVEDLFFGTLTQTSVYPREVVKKALEMNAASVILTHNHPSGVAEPSRADELLTTNLKAALAMVDVRVLDHIITSSSGYVSMAQRGMV